LILSLDLKEEILYRVELAKGYSNRARKDFALRDLSDTMA